MAQSVSQPRRRGALRLLFRLMNSVVGSILRSPVHRLLSGRLALLTFYGRKSGLRYKTPVGYGRTDDALLVDTESPWWRNLQGGAPVWMLIRGEERTGVADVVKDEVGMVEHFRAILSLNPDYNRFVNLTVDAAGAAGGLDRDSRAAQLRRGS